MVQQTLALATLVLSQSILHAQQDTTRLRWVPNPRTTSGSWVSDPAGHLQPRTKAEIDSVISALQRETTAEIAVVVIDSLDGMDPQSAAFTLHRRWGVGERARDNGIVLLWSPRLRQVQISVGYGLEGVLPDAVAGRIQDEVIIPAFRANAFDAGTIAGVKALASTARGETYSGRPAASDNRRPIGAIPMLIGFLFAIPVVIAGSMLVWRRRPRRCPKGHGWMRRMSESADNAALSKEEIVEEEIRSINYDVWVCDQCDERTVVPYKKWMSGYEPCPQCKRRTAKRTMKELVPATYESAGRGELTRACKNCGWARTTEVTIPRKQRSSSGGGSGGRGGGGGSFGGGSSGGGGAGRSY